MSEYNQTPPGWYQAEGDPPGTQRYWDGSSWQGGPQPVAGGFPQVAGSGRPLASLGSRLIAYVIDAFIVIGVMIAGFVLTAVFASVSDVLGGVMLGVTYLVAIGVSIWNFFVRQGRTGQTVGKAQQGIALLDQDGRPPGAGQAFGRTFVGGIIDNVCLINTLWIFFDGQNQRLADKIWNLNVYQQ